MLSAYEVRRPPRSGRIAGSELAARRAAVVATLAAWVFLTAFYFVAPIVPNGDQYLVPPTAHSLVYERNLGLEEFADLEHISTHYGLNLDGVGAPLEDRWGHPVNYFPWLTAVFEVPVIVAVDAASAIGITSNTRELIEDDRMLRLQSLGAAPLAAAAAVVLGLCSQLLLRFARSGGASPSRNGEPWRWWVVPFGSLVAGLATPIWSTASRSMWHHGPAVLLTGVGLAATLIVVGWPEVRHRAWIGGIGGAAMALAYWARPTTLVMSAALLLLLFFAAREVLARTLLGGVVTTAVVLGINLLLLGELIPPYFRGGRVSLHSDFAEAFAANLVSPARGLFVFSPFLVLALLHLLPGRWRESSREMHLTTSLTLGAVAAMMLATAAFPHWWGGSSYGPRLLTESVVFLTPLALAAVIGRQAKASRRFVSWGVAPVLIAWSVAVHGLGSWTDAGGCWTTYPEAIDESPERIWDWNDPLVLMGFRMVLPPSDPTGPDGNPCNPQRTPLVGG